MGEDKPKTETTGERPEPDRARREALAKMGRFAAYTGRFARNGTPAVSKSRLNLQTPPDNTIESKLPPVEDVACDPYVLNRLPSQFESSA